MKECYIPCEAHCFKTFVKNLLIYFNCLTLSIWGWRVRDLFLCISTNCKDLCSAVNSLAQVVVIGYHLLHDNIAKAVIGLVGLSHSYQLCVFACHALPRVLRVFQVGSSSSCFSGSHGAKFPARVFVGPTVDYGFFLHTLYFPLGVSACYISCVMSYSF